MSINLTPEQNREFGDLLADLKQEATTLPQTYKFKFEPQNPESPVHDYYHQENMKMKTDVYRPVSAVKSPAPSASNMACNSIPLSSLEEFKNMYLSMRSESTDMKIHKVPIKGIQPTKTVLKYKKQLKN